MPDPDKTTMPGREPETKARRRLSWKPVLELNERGREIKLSSAIDWQCPSCKVALGAGRVCQCGRVVRDNPDNEMAETAYLAFEDARHHKPAVIRERQYRKFAKERR